MQLSSGKIVLEYKMVGRFVDFCSLKLNHKHWTLICAKSRLRRFLEWLGDREINQQNVELYLMELKTHVSASTLRDHIATFKRLELFLADQGRPVTLIKNISYPKVEEPYRETYTKREVDLLISTPVLPHNNHRKAFIAERRNSIMIMFLFYTGCRLSEMLKLKWKYVDLDEGSITFIERKNRQNQISYIVDPLLSELKKLSYGQGTESYVFKSVNGGMVDQSTFAESLKKRAVLAGIQKNIHPHAFRYTYGTALYEDTGDIYLVKNVLGHKEIQTTEKYLVPSRRRVKKAMQSHPFVRSGLDKNEYLHLIESKMREVIEAFQIHEDKRFKVDLSESSNGLKVSITLTSYVAFCIFPQLATLPLHQEFPFQLLYQCHTLLY